MQLSVTGAVVTDPPPYGLAACSVATPAALAASTGPGLVWATLDAVDDSRARVILGTLGELVRQMACPMPHYRHVDVSTGALGPTLIAPLRYTVATSATRITWEVAVAEGNATLRADLRTAIADQSRPSDVRAELALWLDCCRQPRVDDVSPELRASCYRADDPRLASIAFPSHTRPAGA